MKIYLWVTKYFYEAKTINEVYYMSIFLVKHMQIHKSDCILFLTSWKMEKLPLQGNLHGVYVRIMQ